MRKNLPLIALVVCVLIASGAEARKKIRKPPKDMKTFMCKRGRLLFADDFSNGTLSDEWKILKGKWDIVGGALRGVELAEDDHAAVLKHDMTFRNLIVQFSFRFDGGKAMSFAFNNQNGHVCRLSITPNGFTVRKDKPRRESTEEGKNLDTCSVELEQGRWYTILLEMYEGQMLAYLNERYFALGEHEAIDVEKANFTLTVSGEGILFDDIRVWEALPNKRWKSTRKKFEYIRARMRAASR